MTAGPTPYRKPNEAEVAAQAARVYDLKLKGRSYREIAAEVGISPATALRRLDHYVEQFISPKVEHYRAVQDGQIDALETHLWAAIDDPTGRLDDKLKAIDRLVKLMERRARLHGADAPVKLDGTVTVKTQAEVELESLFSQIDAENAQRRQRIEEGTT